MSSRRMFLQRMSLWAATGGAVGGAILPGRVVAQGAAAESDRLALKGYDPVAYFTLAKPTPGRAEYEYRWDGVRYHFANAKHREMFKAAPESYAPRFGGLCAMNMSAGVRREADPNIWVISNGELYVFAGTAGLDLFLKDPALAASRADVSWKSLKTTPSQ